MVKKAFHILVISILALNLMGAWVFASALDCGMECCDNGDHADTALLEASSCCQLSDVTCGPGKGQHQELFDKAVCHHAGNQKVSSRCSPDPASLIFPNSPALRYPTSRRSAGLAKTLPVYLSKATFLC